MILLRFKVTRKRFTATIFALVCVVSVAVLFRRAGTPIKINGKERGDRLAYIYSRGISVEKSETEKDIIIPTEFSKNYTAYNNTVKKSGFDLSDYKGKAAKLYTYRLKNGNGVFHLITVDGKIAGADFSPQYGGY